MVPIHLDALCLPHGRSVVEAVADFSRLPYFDGQRDVNPDVANVSEEILSQPFQERQLHLKAGIHLHWALPNALSKGFTAAVGTRFPSVPNRWLVTRDVDGKCSRWIVESNYLHPEGNVYAQGSICYPLEQAQAGQQPFRYLGRKMALSAWRENDPHSDNPNYYHHLTAVGYGEPTFAAFYPNCHSVFGFHDADPPLPLNDVQYQVIGWYSDLKQDFLGSNAFKQALETTKQKHKHEPLQVSADAIKFRTLHERFHWLVADDGRAFPEGIFCFAHVSFSAKGHHSGSQQENLSARIAVGNTSTEALAAYLSQTIGKDNPHQVEEQLEALHLATKLQEKQLDIGPKFKEARHEREFTAVPAGTIWTIRPQTAGTALTNEAQVTLPKGPAHLLNDLNLKQQAYDRAQHQLGSLRKQLFADWYKYMLSAYPLEDSRDDYPDIDEVKFFIEQQGLKPLKRKTAATGIVMSAIDKVSGQVQETSAWKFIGELEGASISYLQHGHVHDVILAINRTGHAIGEQAAITQLAEDQAWELHTKDKHFLIRREGIRLYLYLELPENEHALAAQLALAIKNMLKALPDLQRLVAADIRDWPRFREQLGEKELKIPDNRENEALIKKLNEFIGDPRFFRTFPYEKDKLPVEAQELLQQLEKQSKPDQTTFMRCNRLLLEAAFPQHINRRPNYVLKQMAAPRFWRPNEPVILIVGEAAKPSDRHGPTGDVACQLLETDETDFSKLIRQISEQIADQIPAEDDERNGYRKISSPPWHPILLEWEVELFPTKDGSNLDPQQRAYDPHFICRNYELTEKGVDLSLKAGRGRVTKAANIYHGRSILTPHGKFQLQSQIKKYLQKTWLKAYLEANHIDPSNGHDQFLSDHETEIIAWIKNQDGKNGATKQILDAYKIITNPDFHALAQSLGGFNEALLMRKQTLQLPIADPLGFEDYRSFSEEVRTAVRNRNHSAPQPLNDFNPIRSGILKLRRVRLIDTFGQVKELDCERLFAAEVMTVPTQPHLISLRPRLAQPARFNFRWLSARSGEATGDDEPEMNAHPATSPICGWLLPNNLDRSLMIYDQGGRALGSIDQYGRWQSAPGRPYQTSPSINNQHLSKVVKYLIAKGEGFLKNYLDVIENALENIDPENFATHEALALLMGRPLAVVRASLKLELRELPAVHQDWHVFQRDMQRAKSVSSLGTEHMDRESDHFTQVKFPMRIGEYRQFNDGLVGYWIECQDHFKDDTFYAPQTAYEQDTHLKDIAIHRDDRPLNIFRSLADPPLKLTMLLDPRGAVHASCGILPAKSIRIPPDQYVAALEGIEITFLSAPILTTIGKINLPLPTEAGYAWSWVEKKYDEWTEASNIGPLDPQATFSGKQEIREGWLKLRPVEDD